MLGTLQGLGCYSIELFGPQPSLSFCLKWLYADNDYNVEFSKKSKAIKNSLHNKIDCEISLTHMLHLAVQTCLLVLSANLTV